ncbi:MAG: hypothetical protein EA427_02955 [Spirochaetaceae bacterium]|nr:MAG: hypothetical protein EA427_02955 [Spirochaetaceae bacterium]
MRITEFSDYFFTRSVCLPDRFHENGTLRDSVNVAVFAAIHRADDPLEQALGIRTLRRPAGGRVSQPGASARG